MRLVEELGGTVTVASVGPGHAASAVRLALALGADEGVLVTDEVGVCPRRGNRGGPLRKFFDAACHATCPSAR